MVQNQLKPKADSDLCIARSDNGEVNGRYDLAWNHAEREKRGFGFRSREAKML